METVVPIRRMARILSSIVHLQTCYVKDIPLADRSVPSALGHILHLAPFIAISMTLAGLNRCCLLY